MEDGSPSRLRRLCESIAALFVSAKPPTRVIPLAAPSRPATTAYAEQLAKLLQWG